eukprot:jgi/Chlat1/1847/Chrsp14S02232
MAPEVSSSGKNGTIETGSAVGVVGDSNGGSGAGAGAGGGGGGGLEAGLDVTHGVMTNARGKKLFTVQWMKQGSAGVEGLKALVFIAHGYADYFKSVPSQPGGLAEVARRLARRGFGCFGVEHQGHGRSEGTRCHIKKFDYFVDDMLQFIDQVSQQSPNLPKFLIGESMGGAVMIKVARRRPKDFTGLLLVAPMCEIHPSLMPAQTLKMVARVAPKAAVVPGDSKRIIEKAVKNEKLREVALADPMRYHGRSRLKMSLELLRATQDISAHFDEVTVPILAMQGDLDTVTRRESCEALLKGCSSTDKTLRLYPGMWHAILDESEPDVSVVHEDIASWIEERV